MHTPSLTQPISLPRAKPLRAFAFGLHLISATAGLVALSGCSVITGESSVVRPALTEQDRKLLATPTPLIDGRLALIRFDLKSVCLSCGDYYTDNSRSHLTGIEMNSWLMDVYAGQLKDEITRSGIFNPDHERDLILTVKLARLDHNYSLGARADREHPFTSGGSLLNIVDLRYELRTDLSGEPIASWSVITRGSSNSTAPQHRMEEGMRFALLRNVQVFIIELKKALRPGLTAEEEAAYQEAKTRQTDHTRSDFGSFMMHSGRVVNSVSSSVASGTSAFFSALGSAEVQAHVRSSLNEIRANSARMDRQYNNAVNPYAARTNDAIGYHSISSANDKSKNNKQNAEHRRDQNSAQAETDSASGVATPNAKTSNSANAKSSKGKTPSGSSYPRTALTLHSDANERREEREKEAQRQAAAQKAADEAAAKERAAAEARDREEKENLAALEAKRKQACLSDIAQGRHPCGCGQYAAEKWTACSQ